jgi:hypothetical protein
MSITPQQARAELARRELERRGVPLEEPQPIPEQPQQPKPFWSAFGAEITPSMRQTNPYLSAIAQTGQDVATIPAHYFNQLAFNLPRAVAHKFGLQYPETTSPVANIAAKGAGIAGIVTSPLGKAIGRLAKLPVGARLGAKMLQGAKVGALGGAAYTPTEDIVGIPQRLGQAATGTLAGGVLTGLGYAIAKGKNWLNPKNQLKLAEETRISLAKVKNNLIEKYGDVYNRTIKQGQGRVSLQEPLLNLIDESDDIVNTIKGNVEISEALAKGEPNAKRVMNIINQFIENKQVPTNLSLQEADGLQKYIKNLPSIRNKLASQYKGRQVDFTNADRVLLNLANDIKSQVMNLAPEMNLVNKEYGQFMSNYKQIRPYIKWNNAITNFKNIHQLDPAILDKLQQTIPKDVMGKILSLNRTERAAKLAKWVSGIAAGGYVTKKVLSR